MPTRKDGRFPVYIVTCSGSPRERVEHALRQTEAYREIWDISVIDGYTPDDDIVSDLYDAQSNQWLCKRPMSSGEVAIYASHRKAWQTLLASGEDAALLLEDDFTFKDPTPAKELTKHWDAAAASDHLLDMVKLFDFERHRPRVEIASLDIGPLRASRWRDPTAGAVAYVFTKKAASNLLSRRRVFRPVDEDMKYFWELDLNIWSVRDGGIEEASEALGGSIVGGQRTRLRKSTRFRSLYGNLLTAHRKIMTRRANHRFITGFHAKTEHQ
ncbi:MAG: glycosyltransferase family 25 protein [Pseudomonadota bacterium]